MTEENIVYATLVAYLKYYGSQRAGFVLPVFSNNERPYIQIVDDLSDKIVSFQPLEYIPDVFDNRLSSKGMNVGDDQIFVFLDRSGELLIGGLVDLRSRLEHKLASGELSPAVSLQITELYGSNEEKSRYRSEFGKFITNLSDSEAISSSLYESIACSEQWENQVRLSGKKLDRDELRELRVGVQLDALIARGTALREFNLTNKNVLTASRLLKRNQYVHDATSIDEERLFTASGKLKAIYLAGPWGRAGPVLRVAGERIVFEECQTIFCFNETASTTFDSVDDGANIKRMAIEIIATKRQEERIALMLSFILNQESYWRIVLDGYYYDRGRYARSALGTIRKASLHKDDPKRIMEFRFLELVESLFRQCFMDSKGRFLVGVARYMGRDPDVRNFTRAILRNSANMFIIRHRDEIARYID